jgi:serine/threonine protein kinase
VNKEWDVKLSDFGLARFKTQENMDTMSRLTGTYAYASPEQFFGGSYTEKCDVFSLSVVIWEIINKVVKGKYLDIHVAEIWKESTSCPIVNILS